MKFVCFYLLIIITKKNYAEDLNVLMQDELKYLSRELYPEECMDLISYLTIPSHFEPSYEFPRGSYDIAWKKKPQLICLEKLEEWNERNSRDRYARNKLESVLQKLGRPDLVKHFEKNSHRHRTDKDPKIGRNKRNARQNQDSKSEVTELAFAYNELAKTTMKKIKAKSKALEVGPAKHLEKKGFNFSELHFIFYVVIGSLVVLSSLGSLIFAFYRRACRYNHRCTRNFKNEDEERCVAGKVLDEFEVMLCECCSTGGRDDRDGEKFTEFIAKFLKREKIVQEIPKMKRVKRKRREMEGNVICKCKISKKKVRSGRNMVGRSAKFKNLYDLSKNSRRRIRHA